MSHLFRELSYRFDTWLTVLSHGKIALNPFMASAIKNGIDVQDPEARMVVHIGRKTTDMGIITEGRVLSYRSISVSYDTILDDVVIYMARMHGARIDSYIAKQILSAVGSAIPELQNPPKPYEVLAPNRVTGLPMHVPVSHQEIAHCMFRSLECLMRAVESVYISLSSNQQGSIFRQGIFITGEGAELRGLANRFENHFLLPCHVI